MDEFLGRSSLREQQPTNVPPQQRRRSRSDGLLEDHLTRYETFVNSTQGKAQTLRRSCLVTSQPIQVGKQSRWIRLNLGGQFVGLVTLGLRIIGESLIPQFTVADCSKSAIKIGWSNRIDPSTDVHPVASNLLRDFEESINGVHQLANFTLSEGERCKNLGNRIKISALQEETHVAGDRVKCQGATIKVSAGDMFPA